MLNISTYKTNEEKVECACYRNTKTEQKTQSAIVSMPIVIR